MPRTISAATRLVGRAKELATVRALFRQPDVRLVTVTGAGGVGKTRLAVAVARELNDELSGGAFLVRLAGVSDPALILPMIAEQVGVTGQSERPLLEVLRGRFAAQHALLVLDNCEQLLEGRPVLAELLAQDSELRVLVTSQVLLRIAAERAVPRGELAPEDAEGLFLERAAAVDPALARRPPRPPHRADLRAAGLRAARDRAGGRAGPGAASARAGAATRAALDLLTRGERDAPERQRSLRATIDWTHALLELAERSRSGGVGVRGRARGRWSRRWRAGDVSRGGAGSPRGADRVLVRARGRTPTSAPGSGFRRR